MTLVLVNTPTQRYPDEGRSGTYTTMPPFGLGYVATAAAEVIGRENVLIIDGEHEGLSPARLAEKVLSFHPDLVGINMFSPTYEIACEVIENLGPELGQRLLVGGTHAILDPGSILADERIAPYIHAVITGEGEMPIQKILSGVPLESIEGVAYQSEEGTVIRPGWEMPLEHLNDLILDHSFFRNDPNHWSDGITRESYLLSSRGCPFDCHFCAAQQITGRKVRMRNTDSIRRELEQLQENGINYVRFMDDLLLISARRIEELSSVFRDLGLNQDNFGFEANGRANIMCRLPDNYWEMLVEMGFRELEIGIESGSPRILKEMNKSVSPEQVIQTVQRATERGIRIKGFLMVGYPGETVEDLEATLALTSELKDIAGRNIRFSPVPVKAYPGTHLHRQTQELLETAGLKLTDEQPVNLADLFQHDLREEDARILRERTRYNAMHISPEGNPLTLSEIAGGATATEVLWSLAQLILISEGRASFGEGTLGRGKERE